MPAANDVAAHEVPSGVFGVFAVDDFNDAHLAESCEVPLSGDDRPGEMSCKSRDRDIESVCALVHQILHDCIEVCGCLAEGVVVCNCVVWCAVVELLAMGFMGHYAIITSLIVLILELYNILGQLGTTNRHFFALLLRNV